MTPADQDQAGVFERARYRLGAVGAIAGLVTHQIRNRLATLRAALELLAEGLEADLPPEYRAALLLEIDQVIGDFNLGTDMLRGGTVVATSLSAAMIAEEVAASIRPRAVRAAVKLELELGPETDQVSADRRLLRVVLLNLLENAIMAASAAAGGKVVLQVGREGPEVYWEVADSGPGLPEVIYDRWEREPQTSDELVGLGLTLCRDAMLLMGGSIRYLTPRGQPGARFRISLPRAA